jgi:hypothetical protein
MTAARYIIHRVNLNIEAPDSRTARQVQDDATRLFYNWIIPRLEEQLDRLDPKGVVLQLDTIDLLLDPIDPTGFETDFSESLLSRFQEKMEQIIATASGTPGGETPEQCTVMTVKERTFATFLHFLATGQLPWWSGQAPEMLEETEIDPVLTHHLLQAESEAASRLTALLASETTAVERLLLQFSPAFVARLIRLLVESRMDNHREVFSRLVAPTLSQLAPVTQTRTNTALKQQGDMLRTLLQWLNSSRTSTSSSPPLQLHEHPRDLLYRLLQAEPGRTDQPSPSFEHQPSARLHQSSAVDLDLPLEHQKVVAENGMHVDHAGLVLLHPFLEYFFREFQLLDGQGFHDAAARTLSVHLLHFLATGRETPLEYLLTVEKFLCGAELAVPIPRFLRLTAAMKEESDMLLWAAIGHWKVLKNTSPAGLREGFLQRPGKLILSTFENRLIVEVKAHDVLLNYLPWGYGIIKLPWLAKPLLVDWHS